MRLATLLLAVFALFLVGACGGDDEVEQEPATLGELALSAEDAPGSKPDPVEVRETTEEFDRFLEGLTEMAVDPDMEEVTEVFQDAGFEAALVDARFFGTTHSGNEPHVFSSVVELASDEGAASALEWIHEDSLKPCPRTCAVRISEFEVDDVPDAWGVRRTQSAEDIEAVGREDDVPFDSYQIGFTEGSFVHTVDVHGPPGSVSEEQALTIARAWHARLSDLSP